MQLLHHGYLRLPSTPVPVIQRLTAYSKIYRGASPVDRTGTIAFPTRMKSIFPLPQGECRESYAELCARRAKELLQHHYWARIYVAWSGGVDSTCALVSLLEHCKERDRIVVLCDENSIREYPLFYNKVIRGKLVSIPSETFAELIGTENILVSGEGNDQLFGSDIIGDAIEFFGFEAVMGPLQRELITSLYEVKLAGDRDMALFFSDLLGRLRETAPVKLTTNFDLLWWINFAVKWQTTYMRSLIFAKNPITPEYLKAFYHPFFNTPDFQLWSMNNLDHRIKDNWSTYKWPAKDIIYNYTKDANYRDHKVKYGSLRHLFTQRPHHNFLDENYEFQEQMDWYRPQNDFT